MSIWWTIPGFVGLIGVLLLIGGIGRLLKLKFVSGSFRFLFGGAALAGAAVIALIGLNLQTYAQLSKERLAGQVSFKKTADFTYTATVDLADKGVLRGDPTTFEVTGEDFRIEGPVLKWKAWANVMGVDALFRVDHIEGVYVDTNCENRYDPRRQDTGEQDSPNDAFKTVRGLGESWKHLNAVDVVNIQGTRSPMGDGAVYDIKATQGAFELEPNNQIAKELQGQLANRKATTTCAPVTDPVQTPSSAAQPNAEPTLSNNPPASPAPAPPPNPAPAPN